MFLIKAIIKKGENRSYLVINRSFLIINRRYKIFILSFFLNDAGFLVINWRFEVKHTSSAANRRGDVAVAPMPEIFKLTFGTEKPVSGCKHPEPGLAARAKTAEIEYQKLTGWLPAVRQPVAGVDNRVINNCWDGLWYYVSGTKGSTSDL